ncbi:hypothetical protein [Lysinibacter sp. HNR]|uniref:hypothetical protein n=1 Tax=Lysinibacter sp. HNR TaxID=3031408 RepID=UPI002435A421|nr:hypothetical protein [Lysinibacter sp. HNR]WGD37955.1 hypothetical protein FrondiHNR_03295 [Lysinibacter sp. HNR]
MGIFDSARNLFARDEVSTDSPAGDYSDASSPLDPAGDATREVRAFAEEMDASVQSFRADMQKLIDSNISEAASKVRTFLSPGEAPSIVFVEGGEPVDERGPAEETQSLEEHGPAEGEGPVDEHTGDDRAQENTPLGDHESVEGREQGESHGDIDLNALLVPELVEQAHDPKGHLDTKVIETVPESVSSFDAALVAHSTPEPETQPPGLEISTKVSEKVSKKTKKPKKTSTRKSQDNSPQETAAQSDRDNVRSVFGDLFDQ